MNNQIGGKYNGGFLKMIFFIIIALIIMKFLHITFSDIFYWIKTLFNSVF